MLTALDIKNVVLIEQISLPLAAGLTALTGETGAGKSILLDSLSLALGARADAGLVRKGSDQASVTASFEPAADNPVFALLAEAGLSAESPLILRRTVSSDGKSRAFINDQPVSAALLRQAGERLIEIHGQFDTQGLLDPSTHREVLDAFGGHGALCAETRERWQCWQDLRRKLEDIRTQQEQAEQERDFLIHAVRELEQLAPEPGEEQALNDRRVLLANREKIVQALTLVETLIAGEDGAEDRVRQALSTLTRIGDRAGQKMDALLSALDRALADIADAAAEIGALGHQLAGDDDSLEAAEDRLHALRDCARKHRCRPDDLPELARKLTEQLALLEDSGQTLKTLEQEALAARENWIASAEKLSAARARTARALDRAVAKELPPLKLEKARFVTALERLTVDGAGEHGLEKIAFLVAANTGATPGPIQKIASGGELARFMLALKAALAKTGTIPTLIFDEVDSGISGAVAAAVGERLSRLARDYQILVVTHSPQVAACAQNHLVVSKEEKNRATRTAVALLSGTERREEIARMLSGASISEEARAAADRLMEEKNSEIRNAAA